MPEQQKYNWTIADTHEDLAVHIRVRPYDATKEDCAVVMFEVFDLHEYGKVGEKIAWKFQRKDSRFAPDSVDTADEAETLISGSIRFDGCCNVNFGDSNGYIHGCGRQDMTRIGPIFEHLYDAAIGLMTYTCM